MNKSDSENRKSASGGPATTSGDVGATSRSISVARSRIATTCSITTTSSCINIAFSRIGTAFGGVTATSGGSTNASRGITTTSAGFRGTFGGIGITSGRNNNALAGIPPTSSGVGTASGRIVSTSGGVNNASDSIPIITGGAGAALGDFARQDTGMSRKFVLNEGEPFNKSEISDNKHLAGMKKDFADLLNKPTDCNFFQFKSETNWDPEIAHSTFSCEKFFNLNVDLLSQGLECLPLYEKTRIEKKMLPESYIKRCDGKASEAWEKYKEMKENYEKELEEDRKLSKSFEDLTGIKWEPRKPKVVEPQLVEEPVEEGMDLEAPNHGKFWVSHRTELKEKGDDSYLAPSSSDESLEIWLDTYLDD